VSQGLPGAEVRREAVVQQHQYCSRTYGEIVSCQGCEVITRQRRPEMRLRYSLGVEVSSCSFAGGSNSNVQGQLSADDAPATAELFFVGEDAKRRTKAPVICKTTSTTGTNASYPHINTCLKQHIWYHSVATLFYPQGTAPARQDVHAMLATVLQHPLLVQLRNITANLLL
jgi:hypothetical protein